MAGEDDDLEERVTEIERKLRRVLPGRRAVLQGGAAVAAGAAIGTKGRDAVGEAAAQPDPDDGTGNVGTPGDRVDVFANGLDAEHLWNRNYSEFVETATVSGSTTVDISGKNAHWHTLSGDVTYSFTGATSNPDGNSFALRVEGDHEITWPSSVTWHHNDEPDDPGNGEVEYSFVTWDGGSEWLGRVSWRA